MKQLLKILQVFGLFPFIRAGHQLVVSRSLMVYFISVVLMNLTLHVNAVVSITSGVLTEKLDLFSMVSLLLDDMFFGLCVTASLSMLFAWTREIRSILNELLETEKLLECRLKSVPFSTLKLLILLLLCLFKFYESCCYYRLNLNVVPFAYLILMTYLILIDQYFVALIHMNRYLHGIINLKLRLLDKKTALASSRCLRTRHFHLSCLYDKINDCFSVCNLISISVCFIEGIFSVCVFTFADQPWASAFLSSVTWFFYFFKLVTVIEACNNCYREVTWPLKLVLGLWLANRICLFFAGGSNCSVSPRSPRRERRS